VVLQHTSMTCYTYRPDGSGLHLLIPDTLDLDERSALMLIAETTLETHDTTLDVQTAETQQINTQHDTEGLTTPT
jgi:hypothetical protein